MDTQLGVAIALSEDIKENLNSVESAEKHHWNSIVTFCWNNYDSVEERIANEDIDFRPPDLMLWKTKNADLKATAS